MVTHVERLVHASSCSLSFYSDLRKGLAGANTKWFSLLQFIHIQCLMPNPPYPRYSQIYTISYIEYLMIKGVFHRICDECAKIGNKSYMTAWNNHCLIFEYKQSVKENPRRYSPRIHLPNFVLKASFVAQDNFLPVREFYACMPRTKYM